MHQFQFRDFARLWKRGGWGEAGGGGGADTRTPVQVLFIGQNRRQHLNPSILNVGQSSAVSASGPFMCRVYDVCFMCVHMLMCVTYFAIKLKPTFFYTYFLLYILLYVLKDI